VTYKEVKDTAVETLQEHFTNIVVRGTFFYGKPYVWTVDKRGRYHLERWPEGVTL
jgi:hypothetical protein